MQKLAQFILKCLGWSIQGELPTDPKMVMTVAPHSSNWDFPIGLLAQRALKLDCRFVAKRQLFFFPLGLLLRFLGGIPIDRSKANNFVDAAVKLFEQNQRLCLVMTPEGTRAEVSRWKTGFYHIAEKAGVPIVLVGFDYAKKTVSVKKFLSQHNQEQDFKAIYDYYRPMQGRKPKRMPDEI